MKKHLLYIALVAATIVGCQSDPSVECYTSDQQRFVASIPTYNDSTRVSFEDNATGIALSWESNDKFSLYDSAGNYVADLKFSATDNGKSIFEFTDDTATLTDGEQYTALYPALDSAESTIAEHRTALAARVAEQTQSGNSDNSHLSDALRMEAEVTYSESSAEVGFEFEHRMATARFYFESSVQPASVVFEDGATSYTLNMEGLSAASNDYYASLVIEPNTAAASRTVSISIYDADQNLIDSKSDATDKSFVAGYQYRYAFEPTVVYPSAFVSDITATVSEIDHVYKTVYNTTTTGEDLHIYEFSTEATRNSDEPLPAMIFFHGGSWTSSSYTAFRIESQYFATQGVICFSVQYRKQGTDYDGTTATYLDCLRDAKSAIRWVRENAAELNVDPDKIIASGGSAGGHLAAAAAMCDLIDDDPDSAYSPAADLLVLFNPVVNNNNDDSSWKSYPVTPTALNTLCATIGLTASDFSPFHNVDSDVPPTIFMVGDSDTYIPPAVAIEYQRRIEAEGGECELHIYKDQVHSFFGLTSTSSTANAAGFASTVTHSQNWLREKGFINDNDCQVTSWLSYKGYTNWSILDSFQYDTSLADVATSYAKWLIGESEYVVGENVLINGDFEYGDTTGWTTVTASNAKIVNGEYVINGDNTLQVTGAWNITHQQIAVIPGETYEYGYTGRHLLVEGTSGSGDSPYEDNTTGTPRLVMQLRTTYNSSTTKLTSELTIKTGTDTMMSGEVTIPDGVYTTYVVLNQSGNYAYFDDVYVRQKIAVE